MRRLGASLNALFIGIITSTAVTRIMRQSKSIINYEYECSSYEQFTFGRLILHVRLTINEYH